MLWFGRCTPRMQTDYRTRQSPSIKRLSKARVGAVWMLSSCRRSRSAMLQSAPGHRDVCNAEQPSYGHRYAQLLLAPFPWLIWILQSHSASERSQGNTFTMTCGKSVTAFDSSFIFQLILTLEGLPGSGVCNACDCTPPYEPPFLDLDLLAWLCREASEVYALVLSLASACRNTWTRK